MNDLLAALPEQVRQRLRKSPHPRWLQPMLATLTHRRFSDEQWIFERKLDGERCLGFRHGREIRLLSRNAKLLNETYPELVEALAAQVADDFVLDGEVVAFSGGRTSFARLQKRMQIRNAEQARRSGIAIRYYVFDLPYFAGYDLSQVPLRYRKAILQKAMSFGKPLMFTAHRNRQGEAFYRKACKQGWEGLIAKRADSPYVHRRSTLWLKFKCASRQEFVIGGFTEPSGSRIGFGALLVGYYDHGRLKYAGKVGTGFDNRTLRELRSQLDRIERDKSPFADAVREKGAHWVRPELVAEIAFTEWTGDGRLRHPRFMGLRRDKSPRQVVRERAME